MARQLQEQYNEYGRRKQRPFRFLVDEGMYRDLCVCVCVLIVANR